MHLELGTVVACDSAGCDVRLVQSGETIRAAFSEKVKDRIRIRREQLVAIDTAAPSPEIVWRWFRGVVQSGGDAVPVRRLDLPEGPEAPLANSAGLDLQAGDHVYYGQHNDGDGLEVVDIVAGDGPARPLEVAGRQFPAIQGYLATL